METQTSATGTRFIRRSAKTVGSEYIVCNAQNTKVFVAITSSDFEIDDSGKRDQTYLNVVDLVTGQKEKLWLGGQLRHTLSKLPTLKGTRLEITWMGLTVVTDETTGEIREINQYQVHELE